MPVEEKYRSRDSKSREREPPSAVTPPQPPPPATPPSPPLTPTVGGDARLRPEDDPDKASRRRDVVASFYSDQCELIGFKATGSRPPSTHVGAVQDGPAATSSPAASSPSSTRSAASCRAELAEKRREFFKQLTIEDDNSSGGGSRPISRLTDPGSHTTPRHSHYQELYHHHSLPHPPKPTPRSFKYSLPTTPLLPSDTPASTASEETRPLLQSTSEPTPEVNGKLVSKTSENPQVPLDEPDPPGTHVAASPPSQDTQQQQNVDVSGSTQNQPTPEITIEPSLQFSPESEREKHVTGTTPLTQDLPSEDKSQELVSVSSPVVDHVSAFDNSEATEKHYNPVTEDLPVSDNSHKRVGISTTVVEDSFSSDVLQVPVSVPGTVTVEFPSPDSSEVPASETPSEASPLIVDVTEAGNLQLSAIQPQYFQQVSMQSDDERVAEGSCILINEAFPAPRQELEGNNDANFLVTQPPAHEPWGNLSVNEGQVSQESDPFPIVSAQESFITCTDEGHEGSQSIILENSQGDTNHLPEIPSKSDPLQAETVVQLISEVVLGNHHEQVHQTLPLAVDPYFLTSAEEPEELHIEHMLEQSSPQLVDKPVPKQRVHLSEVNVQQPDEVKSTVETVECIPKPVSPLEPPLPPGKTVDAALHVSMTATIVQDKVEPSIISPLVDEEPLPPPPPTPPLDDEPLPPPPPTPPISCQPRLPAVTCSVDLVSSSVLEDDGLGSDIDDALSSLECLNEEGNSKERAAASS